MCGENSEIEEDILNIGTQFVTLGVAKYDKDTNKFGVGVTGEKLYEGAKDITGATAAEENTAMARKQFEDEKKEEVKRRKNAQAQSATEQMAASRQAAGVRSSSFSSSSSSSRASNNGSRRSRLGGDERDFLGL